MGGEVWFTGPGYSPIKPLADPPGLVDGFAEVLLVGVGDVQVLKGQVF